MSPKSFTKVTQIINFSVSKYFSQSTMNYNHKTGEITVETGKNPSLNVKVHCYEVFNNNSDYVLLENSDIFFCFYYDF